MKKTILFIGCLLLSMGSYGTEPYNLYGEKKKNTDSQYYQLLLDPSQTEAPAQSQTAPVESTPIVTEPNSNEQVTKGLEMSPEYFSQDGSAIEYFMVDQRYKDNLKAQKHKAKMEAIPSYHFLLANYAYTFNNSHNVGLTYGWCHAAGVYVNMMFGVSGGHYGTDEMGELGYFYERSNIQLTNEHTHQRISITPGLMVRLGCPLYFNIGLGYAYSTQTNKATNGKWYAVYPSGGVSFQVGFMTDIKKCSLMLNYGFTGSEYLNHELMFGIGVAINGKKGGKQ